MVKTKQDKRKLAAKLEELAENVSKRAVYIPVPQDQYYKIVEYVSNDVIFEHVPNRVLAETMTSRLNLYKKINAKRVSQFKSKISQYHKHNQDAMFFTHIMRNTTDQVRKDVSWFRLNLAHHHMEKIVKELERI